MTDQQKQMSRWYRQFFTRAFVFRYLLTPLGTINITYRIGEEMVFRYTDIYILGIRVARIQREVS